MPNLTKIEDGSMSGLWNLKELHISRNPNLIHIGKNALSRIEEGQEAENWPDLTKVNIHIYCKN